jgi:hypothetical protein
VLYRGPFLLCREACVRTLFVRLCVCCQIDRLFELYGFCSCLFPIPYPLYDEVDDDRGCIAHQLSPNSLSVPRAEPLCVLLRVPGLAVESYILYDRNTLPRRRYAPENRRGGVRPLTLSLFACSRAAELLTEAALEAAMSALFEPNHPAEPVIETLPLASFCLLAVLGAM